MKRLAALVLMLVCMAPAALGETIRMTFVGDCTIGCDISWFKDKRAFTNVIAQEGMDYPFALVRDVFEQDDLTVVNLEGVLADSDEDIMGGRKYNFRGPTEYVKILTGASIELATLGNNHTRDFNKAGIASTKAALTEAGVGWALNGDAFIFEKNGIRIGVISYISNIFTKNLDALPEMVSVLKQEKGCAAVVLCLHAGKEYSFHRGSDQRTYARKAIDAGVDLVIGHHPHVLQGVDIYNNRNVVYSLGNFCFGGNRHILSEHKHSMAVQVEMSFEDGVYAGQRLTILPAINTGTLDRNNYQPYWATGELAQEVMEIVQDDTPYELEPYVEGVGAVQAWLAP